ncbi:MAG: hypothetical protein H0V89_10235 [Deltaproteobacteria bacterium]|nr:hypothetical protein [Deltaproteobacteria bacterium]
MARKGNVQEMMERLMGHRTEGSARTPARASDPRPRREARIVRPEREVDEASPEKKPERATSRRRDAAPAVASDGSLAGKIADYLAERDAVSRDGSRTVDIAEKFELDAIDVRDELMEMERIGLVYRKGRTRGTRWFLG